MCTLCGPICSAEFSPESALTCRNCFPDEQPEFQSIDDFEKYLVTNHRDIAEQLLEADRQFLRNRPKKPSKKRMLKERKEKLEAMAAAVGRTAMEGRIKKKKKELPIVKLTIWNTTNEDEKPDHELIIDARFAPHKPLFAWVAIE